MVNKYSIDKTRQDKTRQDKTIVLLARNNVKWWYSDKWNTLDHTFESANRVYDKNQLCPIIPTCAGGGIQPRT